MSDTDAALRIHPGPHEDANDLMVVSNRGPLSFAKASDGHLEVTRGGGGLVVTLGPGVRQRGARWLASVVSDADREAAGAGIMEAEGYYLQPLVIDADAYRAYYDVIANGSLWFGLHGLWDLPRRPRFDRHWRKAWEVYREVNQRFATAAAQTAAAGATVLIQDYHLSLVGAMLAAQRPDLKTAVFLHTPFCSPSELATFPEDVARDLLAGLAGAGACGFHSARWAKAFEACCHATLGWAPPTFVAPAAPDAGDLRRVATSSACEAEVRRLSQIVGDRRLIVRVDRLELSKNVLRGFSAFDELLEQRPDLRGRVVFASFLYPSRLGLADYQGYGLEVKALVKSLNEKWSTPAWTPIVIDTEDNYVRSVAALRRFDVLLVNPIRDGLNLVAKEGALVNERFGALALSRQAGSWDELGDHAIGLNPFDVSGTAAALASALDLPEPARVRRALAWRQAVAERTPEAWFDRQVDSARTPGARSHPAAVSRPAP